MYWIKIIALLMLAMSIKAMASTDLLDANFSKQEIRITPSSSTLLRTSNMTYNDQYGNSWVMSARNSYYLDDGLHHVEEGSSWFTLAFEKKSPQNEPINLVLTHISVDGTAIVPVPVHISINDVEVIEGAVLDKQYIPEIDRWIESDTWTIENYLVNGTNSLKVYLDDSESYHQQYWINHLRITAEP